MQKDEAKDQNLQSYTGSGGDEIGSTGLERLVNTYSDSETGVTSIISLTPLTPRQGIGQNIREGTEETS